MIASVALDGLTLHDINDPTCPYSVSKKGLDGLAEPTYRTTAYERAGEDGGDVASSYVGMRAIALSGRVRGSDDASFAQVRRALLVKGRIDRDSNSRPVAKQLVVTTLAGETFTAEVHVRKLSIQIEDNNVADYLFELLAPKGYLEGTTSTSSGQVARPTSVGANFPWVFDPTIEFGLTTGGTFVVDNPGTADTWPVLTLRGPLTDPVIRHQGTGKFMELDTTLTSDDEVVIDMRNKTVVLNGSSNYLYTRTTDSEWFSLAPDSNVISFDTSNVSDTGTVELTYVPAYLGI